VEPPCGQVSPSSFKIESRPFWGRIWILPSFLIF
jgi:hypothetical protein